MRAGASSDNFYFANARWLAVGLLCTLCSAFGQTFFISLFADRIMAVHGLSHGAWGSIYAAATLSSAALLVQAGRLADTVRLQRLTLGVLGLYALVAFGMALDGSAILLFLMITGLRFCGQGMISHIGVTAIARWFHEYRGRALAVTGLGYSLGEAVLPAAAVCVIALLGWRGAWMTVGLVLVVVFTPLLALLLTRDRIPRSADIEEAMVPGLGGRHWSRGDALGHWLLWALIPGILTPSFIVTVIFFHQLHVATIKDWHIADMALGYPVYAIATVLSLVVAGQIIDRGGAVRLLPVYLLPIALGVALIGEGEGIWAWYVALGLVGFGNGLGETMKSALWAEVYGTRHIGAIRAMVVSKMVFASALGPGLTGLLIDAGIPFPDQGLALALWCLAVSAGFLIVTWRLVADRHSADTVR